MLNQRRVLVLLLLCLIGSATPSSMGQDAETPPTSKPRLVVQTGNGMITSVAFSPDGLRALTGSQDKTARLWDIETGRELRRFVGHSLGLTAVAFTPDGTRVITASRDFTARIWDIDTGLELQKFGPHSGAVTSIAGSLDGKRVLTGAWRRITTRTPNGAGGVERIVRVRESWLWDVETGQGSAFLDEASGVISVADAKQWETQQDWALSPIGNQALVADGAKVRLVDSSSLNELLTLVGHTDTVTSVAFSPDGMRALTGSGSDENLFDSDRDNTARLWDLETGELLQVFKGRSHSLNALAISADGAQLLTGSFDHLARLWDLRTGRQAREFEGHRDEVSAVAFSVDGTGVITGSADTTIRLWGLDASQGGTESRSVLRDAGRVKSLALSPDGQHLLTGSWEYSGALWNLANDRKVREFLGLSVAFSPDGERMLLGSAENNRYVACLTDVATGAAERLLVDHSGEVMSVAFSPDGMRFLTAGSNPFRPNEREAVARLWDLKSGRELQRFEGHSAEVLTAILSPDGERVLTGSNDNTARLWDVATGQVITTFEGHAGLIMSVTFASAGKRVLTASYDSTTRVWNAESGEELAQLVSFDDGTWAVVDREGRFDAPNGGDVSHLHWVVGLEPIALSQLKARFYEPGLLAKVMGFSEEPLRDVGLFDRVDLFPGIEINNPNASEGRLSIQLTNRDGGMGRVQVLINGKEIQADARGDGFDPDAETAELALDLSRYANLLKPGEENDVEVRVFNKAGYLSSRSLRRSYKAPGKKREQYDPHLWALVIGTSHYRGSHLNLKFSAKDAEDIATALRVSASKLFEARVHLSLLATSDEKDAIAPTRQNIEAAFQRAAEGAKPGDLLFVYLAGHGVNLGGPEGDFYYLTCDAPSAELSDTVLREQVTVSSDELTRLINRVPALKQVLILDTCASGRVIEKLTRERSVESSQLRALDRMKDRTGMYVLAGCASDAVSYEATQYAQGLLTHSLLQGMRGGALRADEFVDVSQWFEFAADRVPQLAKDIGGVQRPMVATPRGGSSFDVGRVTIADRDLIPLESVRPLFVRSSFQDDDRFDDHLGLTQEIDASLRGASARTRGSSLVYLDTRESPDAFKLAGRYWQEGQKIHVKVRVFQGSRAIDTFELTGEPTHLAKLAAQILEKAEATVSKDPTATDSSP